MTNVWNNTCEIEDISTHILTKRMTFVLISVFTVVFVISTHILTKRMTAIVAEAGPEIVISTHILTKRMTKIKIHNDVWKVISTHILTKRMTTFTSCKTFKGRKFQLTSSRRGWRPCFLQASHSCIFQLTSSRRGWRKLSRKSRISGYFNSHPHEEDDDFQRYWLW